MQISEVLEYEMVHWNSDGLFIAHKGNTITYKRGIVSKKIMIPTENLGYKKVFLPFRLTRRALRLDKTMIVPTREGFVAVRRGNIFVYNLEQEKWTKSGTTLNCRNPMYDGILAVDDFVYIAEYGNPNGTGKRILMSKDGGYSWECVYQFSPEEIRHIHCLCYDPYSEKIWICTGDFEKEPQIFAADIHFDTVEKIGGGSQYWRTCHLIFTKDTVEWAMDSPLEDVHHIRYDRATREISVGQMFPGPVWFSRKYGDQYIAATAQEIGPSHKDQLMHVYKSADLKNWEEIGTFKYDGLPKRYFRFGTITCARGDKAYLCCEGVKGFDGKTIGISL